VQQEEQALAIDIRDDGVGFDVDQATRTGHYGLLGMRERARLVGGSFSLESEPGQGSRLSIILPLEAA
jgi:signal transduction histidine kinase